MSYEVTPKYVQVDGNWKQIQMVGIASEANDLLA